MSYAMLCSRVSYGTVLIDSNMSSGQTFRAYFKNILTISSFLEMVMILFLKRFFTSSRVGPHGIPLLSRCLIGGSHLDSMTILYSLFFSSSCWCSSVVRFLSSFCSANLLLRVLFVLSILGFVCFLSLIVVVSIFWGSFFVLWGSFFVWVAAFLTSSLNFVRFLHGSSKEA